MICLQLASFITFDLAASNRWMPFHNELKLSPVLQYFLGLYELHSIHPADLYTNKRFSDLQGVHIHLEEITHLGPVSRTILFP